MTGMSCDGAMLYRGLTSQEISGMPHCCKMRLTSVWRVNRPHIVWLYVGSCFKTVSEKGTIAAMVPAPFLLRGRAQKKGQSPTVLKQLLEFSPLCLYLF